MRIAIAMRRTAETEQESEPDNPECFAEFEVDEGERSANDTDEDVQVTVVLRGKRGELENPALGVTELVLRALEGRGKQRTAEVIDVSGVAVEPAYATG
jgi:hypothetical protein